MEKPSPVGDDHFLDSMSNHSELVLLFYCVPLEESFNGVDLESLTNQTHFIYCVFPYPDVPSASNFPTVSLYNDSLVGCIGIYINYDPTDLSDCFPVISDSGSSLSISPLQSYSIGYITLIPDLCLNGMANGMII